MKRPKDPMADLTRPYGMSLAEFWHRGEEHERKQRERVEERRREQEWVMRRLGA
jgi:hypothetical protein